MAFVNRGQRKMDHQRPQYSIGPGSYEIEAAREIKIGRPLAAFGTNQIKGKESIIKSSGYPGPGSYNIGETQNGEKIVVSSDTQDIKILEISRPHPVFKSGTDRFPNLKEEVTHPGPGDYNINKPILQRPKMLSTNTTSNKPKIIEHLISINKYQSIPSIPSNIHAYGYNQNQTNELELNEPPVEIYKGEKEDRVGPGHYNSTVKERVKGVSCWSQAKEKKIQERKEPSLSIGPGSYDVKTVQSLYNYKQTSNFASKTLRSGDQRKGVIAQQNLQAKKIAEKIIEDTTSSHGSQMDSRVFSQKNPPSTMIDDESDDQYEYVDDTTPGPGSYLEISEVRRFNKPLRSAVPSFGIGTKRFNYLTNIPTISQVGPGSYNIPQQTKKIKSQSRNKGTQGTTKRFPDIDIKKGEQPGPGAYQPRNTMEDKLIYKIQRGYRGQFGSTQVRGKQIEENDEPGPGQYDPQQVSTQKESLSVFRSNTQRKGVNVQTGNVPAPGSYNMNHYDISTKVIKEEEDDPDLIIKKPGFGVGERRFKEAPSKDEDFEDDDIIKEIQQKYKEERKRKGLKNSAAFKSTDPRIKQVKNDLPGPGAYYDGQQDHWNKRTYNILFADI